jgi:hypothetical protein
MYKYESWSIHVNARPIDGPDNALVQNLTKAPQVVLHIKTSDVKTRVVVMGVETDTRNDFGLETVLCHFPSPHLRFSSRSRFPCGSSILPL